MTDLEMTKLCAEAMGYVVEDSLGSLVRAKYECRTFSYNPLANDGQAMALVKTFKLSSYWCGASWLVKQPVLYLYPVCGDQKDLNRAIVECVSKMHSKTKQLWLSTSP